ncbi:MAG: presenilin family intramembrane aspartyl protease [Candidatus Micrarchaeota archaeon]|nr:presenilin family intramembrane aspartyl protease [Candidatus Micrarchaeota archaeon]
MKLIFNLLVLFIVAQLMGIYTGIIILNDTLANPYVASFAVNEDINEPINALYYFGFILIGAVFIIIMIRFFKTHEILFRLLEFFMISTSSSIVFYAISRIFLDYGYATTFGIAAGLAFAAIKFVLPKAKNAAAVLATAGVGAIFGISFGLVPAVLFLVLLSLYDFVAVFTTKHMVEMAEFIIKKDLAFTITAQTAEGTPRFVEGKRHRIDLGTGDIIAPIMLEVSVLPFGFNAVIMVFLGATVSLLVFLHLFLNKKLVLPALPPLVLGMLLFFLIGLLAGIY